MVSGFHWGLGMGPLLIRQDYCICKSNYEQAHRNPNTENEFIAIHHRFLFRTAELPYCTWALSLVSCFLQQLQKMVSQSGGEGRQLENIPSKLSLSGEVQRGNDLPVFSQLICVTTRGGEIPSSAHILLLAVSLQGTPNTPSIVVHPLTYLSVFPNPNHAINLY